MAPVSLGLNYRLFFKGRGSTQGFTVFRSEVDFEMSETHIVVNIYKYSYL